MVLWEITAATAYFLGLRRTYRLALRIQRRVVGPNHPKIREFIHRRTRNIFDMAVKVHKNIQHRDIEVGRNLGNWILRWLDRMKPSAQIRPRPPDPPTSSSISNGLPSRHVTASGKHLETQRPSARITDQESNNGRQLFAPLNIRPKYFPTISMMMQPKKPAGISGQYRRMSYNPSSIPAALGYSRGRFQGVLRRDIAEWMLLRN